MGKGRILRGWMLALVLWLGSAAAAGAQPLIDLVEFRDRVAAEVRRDQPDAKIVLLGRVGLRVILPGAPPKDQSMERPYALYREEPHRLAEFVSSYARSFRPIPVTAESLRVLVRTDASNPPPEPGDDGRGLTRQIAGGLLAIVAIDGPDAFEFPRASRLRASLRMDDAAIWARALSNTRDAIPYEPRQLIAGQPAGLESGKGLSSSLVVDEAFWNSRIMTAQGPIVVALAGRDEIYLAPLGDKAMVDAFRDGLAQGAREGGVLYPQLLVRRNARWEVLP